MKLSLLLLLFLALAGLLHLAACKQTPPVGLGPLGGLMQQVHLLVLLIILLLEDGENLVSLLALILALLQFICDEHQLVVDLLKCLLGLLLGAHVLIHLGVIGEQVVSVLVIVLDVFLVQRCLT